MNTNAILSRITTEVSVVGKTGFVMDPSFGRGVSEVYGLCAIPCLPKYNSMARVRVTLRANYRMIGLFPNNLLNPKFVGSIRNPVP